MEQILRRSRGLLRIYPRHTIHTFPSIPTQPFRDDARLELIRIRHKPVNQPKQRPTQDDDAHRTRSQHQDELFPGGIPSRLCRSSCSRTLSVSCRKSVAVVGSSATGSGSSVSFFILRSTFWRASCAAFCWATSARTSWMSASVMGIIVGGRRIMMVKSVGWITNHDNESATLTSISSPRQTRTFYAGC